MTLLEDARAATGAAAATGVSRTDAHERAGRDATDWIAAFGAAWRDADTGAAGELFADDARYWWGPFEQLTGRDAIVDRWRSATDRHQHLRFDYGVLAIEGPTTIAHWHAVLDRPTACIELNGILCVTLDDDGRCTEFREWWDRRELPPATD